MKINDLLIENCYNSQNTEKIKALANEIAASISNDEISMELNFEGSKIYFLFDGELDTSENHILEEMKDKFYEDFAYRYLTELRSEIEA